MGVKRLVRVNELLRQEIATALYRVMNEEGFDLSAVTVTHVVTSSDLRTARVLVSIRDHRQERETMLKRLGRHAPRIQALIHQNVALKYTPKLTFALDESIEQGDRILQILSEMAEAAPAEPPAGGTEGEAEEPGTPPEHDET